MKTINSLLQASEKIDLSLLIENALIATVPDYVELQRMQLFGGLLSDGTEIERIGAKYKGYSPTTIKIKTQNGQPTDRITLKDTGSFYGEIFADPRSEGIVSGSQDDKTNKLQKDYGEKIFGLSDDPKQAYVNKVRPVLIEEVENALSK